MSRVRNIRRNVRGNNRGRNGASSLAPRTPLSIVFPDRSTPIARNGRDQPSVEDFRMVRRSPRRNPRRRAQSPVPAPSSTRNENRSNSILFPQENRSDTRIDWNQALDNLIMFEFSPSGTQTSNSSLQNTDSTSSPQRIIRSSAEIEERYLSRNIEENDPEGRIFSSQTIEELESGEIRSSESDVEIRNSNEIEMRNFQVLERNSERNSERSSERSSEGESERSFDRDSEENEDTSPFEENYQTSSDEDDENRDFNYDERYRYDERWIQGSFSEENELTNENQGYENINNFGRISDTPGDNYEERLEERLEENLFQELRRTAILFSNNSYLMIIANPVTKYQAIILSAKNYKIDISKSQDPIQEYKNICIYRPYIVKDENLIEICKYNERRIYLDLFFNPSLPEEVYSPELLRSLSLFEGYNYSNFYREADYSLLQSAYLSENFYQGKHHNIKNDRTFTYYEDVDQLTNGYVVCFGILDQNMTLFTYEELSEIFSHHRYFYNPIDSSTFEPNRIKKLKNICIRQFSYDTPETMIIKNNLLEVIKFVEIFTEMVNVQTKELYEMYENGNNEQKKEIKLFIVRLMNLGLYMRGWNGVDSDLPIKIAIVSQEYEPTVFLKVSTELISFFNDCSENNMVGNLILNQKLYKRSSGEDHLYHSQDGDTVKDKLNVIFQGEYHENNNSCIRLSSNIICSTAHRLMRLLKMSTPFDIDDLRWIT